MLSTIDLNNQPLFHTYKIHYVVPHRLLPLELETHETMRPQAIPQPLFSFSLVGTQSLGVV